MNIAGDVLIVLGLAFMVITALGLVRLPDFFSRVHAVSKSETLGIALLLLGLILHEGATLLSLKFALILVFVAIANPVGAHLLTRAALRTGELPWRKEERR
ncbi:MAG: monovalent cation/H(+) antiporter subunit G [Chloroflexi bacterium]|nr:monovalent cation/H(+) antiporter subunit G [Chloroflexota bacterium]